MPNENHNDRLQQLACTGKERVSSLATCLMTCTILYPCRHPPCCPSSLSSCFCIWMLHHVTPIYDLECLLPIYERSRKRIQVFFTMGWKPCASNQRRAVRLPASQSPCIQIGALCAYGLRVHWSIASTVAPHKARRTIEARPALRCDGEVCRAAMETGE